MAHGLCCSTARDLLGSGIKPVSHALADGILSHQGSPYKTFQMQLFVGNFSPLFFSNIFSTPFLCFYLELMPLGVSISLSSTFPSFFCILCFIFSHCETLIDLCLQICSSTISILFHVFYFHLIESLLELFYFLCLIFLLSSFL